MELEEHVYEPDSEEMEVDTLDWEVRDRVDLARQRAIRKRRAALQLLAELEDKERLMVELQESLKDNIMRDWEKEEWSYISGELIVDTGLEVKASWNPDLDTKELSKSGEMVGKGKHISWSIEERKKKFH